MIGQPFVFFLVKLNNLSVITFLVAENNIRSIGIFHKDALNRKEFLIVQYVLGINDVEIALAEGKIMNGIQQIGFANAVAAYETIDLVRQFQFNRGIILEIGKY